MSLLTRLDGEATRLSSPKKTVEQTSASNCLNHLKSAPSKIPAKHFYSNNDKHVPKKSFGIVTKRKDYMPKEFEGISFLDAEQPTPIKLLKEEKITYSKKKPASVLVTEDISSDSSPLSKEGPSSPKSKAIGKNALNTPEFQPKPKSTKPITIDIEDSPTSKKPETSTLKQPKIYDSIDLEPPKRTTRSNAKQQQQQIREDKVLCVICPKPIPNSEQDDVVIVEHTKPPKRKDPDPETPLEKRQKSIETTETADDQTDSQKTEIVDTVSPPLQLSDDDEKLKKSSVDSDSSKSKSSPKSSRKSKGNKKKKKIDEPPEILSLDSKDGEEEELPRYPVAFYLQFGNTDQGRVSVRSSDRELLLPDTFLNDTIIEFYLKYIAHQLLKNDPNPERYYIFNTFFLACLVRGQTDLSSKAYVTKANIFSRDFVFIPVNKSLHWSMFVVCYPNRVPTDRPLQMPEEKLTVIGFDSLYERASHNGTFRTIENFLKKIWPHKNDLYFQRKWGDVPGQDNSADCGLFLLHYVEMFVRNPPSPSEVQGFGLDKQKWFDPKEAREKRKRITELIDRFALNPKEGEELKENEEEDEFLMDAPLINNGPLDPTVTAPDADEKPATPLITPPPRSETPPLAPGCVSGGTPIVLFSSPSLNLEETPTKKAEKPTEVVEIDDSLSLDSEDETSKKTGKKAVPSQKEVIKEVLCVTSRGGDSDHESTV